MCIKPLRVITSLSVILFLCASFFAQSSCAQFYTLNPGDGLSEGISDNGIVTGSFGNVDDEYFLWRAGQGGKVNIGGVPAGGGVGGQAKISNDGSRIGGTTFNSTSGFHEMSYYDVASGVWTPVGGIGGSSGSEVSSGWNISGDGRSVVGLGWVDAGSAHAIHWRNGIMNDLGSTIPGQSTRANAVDFDGNVIGGWQDGAGRQGAVWVNGVQELIFNNSNQAALEVFDVSGTGRYASGLGIRRFGQGQAYRYDVELNEYLALPTLLGGANELMAGTAISDDGNIIGGGTWGTGPAIFGNGYVWEQGVGTMSVEDFLTSKGVSGWDPNFHFSFVSGISSDGRWLTGWGYVGTPGASRSWAARVVPEPGSTGMLGLLAAAFLMRRRRNSAAGIGI